MPASLTKITELQKLDPSSIYDRVNEYKLIVSLAGASATSRQVDAYEFASIVGDKETMLHAVRFDDEQELNETQQITARKNIDACCDTEFQNGAVRYDRDQRYDRAAVDGNPSITEEQQHTACANIGAVHSQYSVDVLGDSTGKGESKNGFSGSEQLNARNSIGAISKEDALDILGAACVYVNTETGDDANSGLYEYDPVNSWGKAYEIAATNGRYICQVNTYPESGTGKQYVTINGGANNPITEPMLDAKKAPVRVRCADANTLLKYPGTGLGFSTGLDIVTDGDVDISTTVGANGVAYKIKCADGTLNLGADGTGTTFDIDCGNANVALTAKQGSPVANISGGKCTVTLDFSDSNGPTGTAKILVDELTLDGATGGIVMADVVGQATVKGELYATDLRVSAANIVDSAYTNSAAGKTVNGGRYECRTYTRVPVDEKYVAYGSATGKFTINATGSATLRYMGGKEVTETTTEAGTKKVIHDIASNIHVTAKSLATELDHIAASCFILEVDGKCSLVANSFVPTVTGAYAELRCGSVEMAAVDSTGADADYGDGHLVINAGGSVAAANDFPCRLTAGHIDVKCDLYGYTVHTARAIQLIATEVHLNATTIAYKSADLNSLVMLTAGAVKTVSTITASTYTVSRSNGFMVQLNSNTDGVFPDVFFDLDTLCVDTSDNRYTGGDLRPYIAYIEYHGRGTRIDSTYPIGMRATIGGRIGELRCEYMPIWKHDILCVASTSQYTYRKLVDMDNQIDPIVIWVDGLDGNDAYLGTDSAHPIKSMERVLEIIDARKKISPSSPGIDIHVLGGAGDYNVLTLDFGFSTSDYKDNSKCMPCIRIVGERPMTSVNVNNVRSSGLSVVKCKSVAFTNVIVSGNHLDVDAKTSFEWDNSALYNGIGTADFDIETAAKKGSSDYRAIMYNFAKISAHLIGLSCIVLEGMCTEMYADDVTVKYVYLNGGYTKFNVNDGSTGISLDSYYDQTSTTLKHYAVGIAICTGTLYAEHVSSSEFLSCYKSIYGYGSANVHLVGNSTINLYLDKVISDVSGSITVRAQNVDVYSLPEYSETASGKHISIHADDVIRFVDDLSSAEAHSIRNTALILHAGKAIVLDKSLKLYDIDNLADTEQHPHVVSLNARAITGKTITAYGSVELSIDCDRFNGDGIVLTHSGGKGPVFTANVNEYACQTVVTDSSDATYSGSPRATIYGNIGHVQVDAEPYRWLRDVGVTGTGIGAYIVVASSDCGKYVDDIKPSVLISGSHITYLDLERGAVHHDAVDPVAEDSVVTVVPGSTTDIMAAAGCSTLTIASPGFSNNYLGKWDAVIAVANPHGIQLKTQNSAKLVRAESDCYFTQATSDKAETIYLRGNREYLVSSGAVLDIKEIDMNNEDISATGDSDGVWSYYPRKVGTTELYDGMYNSRHVDHIEVDASVSTMNIGMVGKRGACTFMFTVPDGVDDFAVNLYCDDMANYLSASSTSELGGVNMVSSTKYIAGHVYQVSIIDGLGVVADFSVDTEESVLSTRGYV